LARRPYTLKRQSAAALEGAIASVDAPLASEVEQFAEAGLAPLAVARGDAEEAARYLALESASPMPRRRAPGPRCCELR
jgi:hypothetical protein